ncbi:hypothetical protein LCGC14_3074820 [marine sediment metagenome]|uniref:Uncharacterized protein n=1 Tax=marine sediment metagenome TaxID=412755 RepID=A0A0F8WF23_9ZZZZ
MPNNEIVFLYTKNFEWKDGNSKIEFNNKPEISRVYVAAKDKESGFYRLILPNNGRAAGIIVDNLTTESDRWDCNFIPLTYKNILLYKLHKDDIKMIHSEIDNNTISSEYPGMLEEEPENNIQTLARDKQVESALYDALDELKDTDRIAYETIVGLTLYLATKFSIVDGNIFLDNAIRGGNKLGKSASVALMLNEIQDYMLEEYSPHKLIKAVYYIVQETLRYKLTDQNE